jgi:hypothetical protein
MGLKNIFGNVISATSMVSVSRLGTVVCATIFTTIRETFRKAVRKAVLNAIPTINRGEARLTRALAPVLPGPNDQTAWVQTAWVCIEGRDGGNVGLLLPKAMSKAGCVSAVDYTHTFCGARRVRASNLRAHQAGLDAGHLVEQGSQPVQFFARGGTTGGDFVGLRVQSVDPQGLHHTMQIIEALFFI